MNRKYLQVEFELCSPISFFAFYISKTVTSLVIEEDAFKNVSILKLTNEIENICVRSRWIIYKFIMLIFSPMTSPAINFLTACEKIYHQ